MTKQDETEGSATREIIRDGMADWAGALISLAAGAAIGGPIEATVGTIGQIAVATVFKVGADIVERRLSPREKERVNTTTRLTKLKIEENISAGHQLRQDDFFLERPLERPAAEEIAEGVLAAAQKEYEEKKLQFYAYLLGNLPFHPEIGRSHANYLLRQVRQMSYRQICLLAIFTNKNEFDIPDQTIENIPHQDIIHEILDLYGSVFTPGYGGGYGNWGGMNLTMIEVGEPGTTLYKLMELWRLDSRDIQTTLSSLKHPS